MSVAIVEHVRVKYPTPLGNQHGAFLIDLARTLGGGAGLLSKKSGTRIYVAQLDEEVAQDIICYRVGSGATHFDVLRDGEGAAEPTWHEVGPIDPGRYVDVGNASVPQPPPTLPIPGPIPPNPGTPPVDLAPILARLSALENEIASVKADAKDTRAVVAAESKDIRAIIAALPKAEPLPIYKGSLWGIRILSKPCPECK